MGWAFNAHRLPLHAMGLPPFPPHEFLSPHHHPGDWKDQVYTEVTCRNVTRPRSHN